LLTYWGRSFLVGAAVLAALFVWQQFGTLPPALDLVRRIVTLVSLAGLAALAVVAVIRHRAGFLWRVRRKLMLSYVFLGFVPLVLVLAFVLTGGMFLYMTVVSYVFNEAIADIVDDVRQVATTSAIELGRPFVEVQAAIDRKHENLSELYPELSLTVVRADGGADAHIATAGHWSHGAPPASVPAWVRGTPGASGIVIQEDSRAPGGIRLIARAAIATPDRRRFVVADLPIDEAIVRYLHDRTGVRPGESVATDCGAGRPAPPLERSVWNLFSEAIVYMDCTRWADGGVGSLAVRVSAPVGDISNHLASVRSARVAATVGQSLWSIFETLLIALAGLFLVIQGAALVLGGVLARSITSAVHELFVGTERVQQGDFTHRIPIESRDQLGALADSFNRMSTSIQKLLQVQRDKQRLDEELRIAREIQKSLLPVRPPRIPGLDIADLCEPAREVGGDYYDFFELGPRQLGVLVADVSGKGTSAALYMAELKGLTLALSQIERSPRQLLIRLNQHLAEHLDNRSFITMTYAVIDLERRTLTSARAGHTPLIVVSGGISETIVTDGMVLGLRLPHAAERFNEILEEHTRTIAPGDLIVLYTDGITEATNADDELFGDEALAELLASQHHLDAAGIRERIVRDVRAFVGTAEPHDDMTMVVIKIGEEA
jgi:sigma-B regulation protein RsbU (phosphoserine phosphatase)